jgi:glycerol-3-phosphate dehydrogenase
LRRALRRDQPSWFTVVCAISPRHICSRGLHERTSLFNNVAPHLAQPLLFIMPSYHWWETLFYGVGLKMYDALLRRFGKTEF